jgi:hypothetical protein
VQQDDPDTVNKYMREFLQNNWKFKQMMLMIRIKLCKKFRIYCHKTYIIVYSNLSR